MQICRTTFRGRAAWEMDNDALRVIVLVGGGHLASIKLRQGPALNPLWVTPWPTREPWTCKPESRLLSSIAGHNICLGQFGGPSAAEARAGLGGHGEAPVVRWRRVSQRVTGSTLHFVCAADLPVAQLRITRTFTTRRGERNLRVRDDVQNLSRRDLPYTACQHVTIGPPFLEKGVTTIDMSATRGHTFPGRFSDRQRLKPDTAFTWPNAPGANGKPVDLRTIDPSFRKSSDFSTQLMNPRRADSAWFSACNPKLGLLLAYHWNRADYPWLGNWEENFARRDAPWSGRSLARGLEFANTPFPEGLRAAVDRGQFQGEPTYRWVPARGTVATEFTILLMPLDSDAQGVADIRSADGMPVVTLRAG